MNKAKTNALDALRALIAERQQYEQWISTLESKRDSTPAHVLEKVNADYESRLDRVVGEISGYAEELQLSITTLSSRLIEVAREEDTKRDTLQEAELRAAVGEYEPARWEELRLEGQREIDRIGGDRERLDNELAELRSIQTLSAVGSRPPVGNVASGAQRVDGKADREDPQVVGAIPDARASSADGESDEGDERVVDGDGNRNVTAAESEKAGIDAVAPERAPVAAAAPPVTASAASAAASEAASAEPPSRTRPSRTPPKGISSGKAARPADARADQSKTLKCPECGTPNHPTEWYCERCGGELATM
ncbi:MAG: hypothetical protein H0U13_01800 [Gemmatimonadaceae bacterium]|nr:hypothetical protein [Gemmatimonadaceae bacterium]